MAKKIEDDAKAFEPKADPAPSGDLAFITGEDGLPEDSNISEQTGEVKGAGGDILLSQYLVSEGLTTSEFYELVDSVQTLLAAGISIKEAAEIATKSSDPESGQNLPVAYRDGNVTRYEGHGDMSHLTGDAVVIRMKYLERVIQSQLIDGVHIASVAGSKKKSLLQPGAQFLCTCFRMAPRFHVSYEQHDGEHRTYTVRCELYHIETGSFLGEGVSVRSTLESNYRYVSAREQTSIQVPQAYWNSRDEATGEWNDTILIKALNDAGEVIPEGWKVGRQKDDSTNKWMITMANPGAKKEYPNPADKWGIVIKMASKSALVHAVLNVTGASSAYTQDEDLVDQANSWN